jgi:hypothetical protein
MGLGALIAIAMARARPVQVTDAGGGGSSGGRRRGGGGGTLLLTTCQALQAVDYSVSLARQK